MSPIRPRHEEEPTAAVPIIADDVWQRPEMLDAAFASYEPPPLHPTDWDSASDAGHWQPAELERSF